MEQAQEDRFSFGNRGGAQRLTAEQEATVAVTDGEWIAILAIVGFELTFEISAPDIVGSQDLAGGLARMTDDATTPFVGNQAVTAQNLADGSSMRPRPARMFLAEDLEQFLSSPAGMVAASLEDRCHPLSWGLIGRHPRFA